MVRTGIALILLSSGSVAVAADTDWGIREVGKSTKEAQEPPPAGTWGFQASATGTRVDMAEISQIGARWGQVTSTYRSPSNNRWVGGVANSYHLRNRAIDIARKPGVSHWQIAAAFRGAGYSLAESLDEGDHSHFAFGPPKRRSATARPQMVAVSSGEKTEWRVIYAPPTAAGGN